MVMKLVNFIRCFTDNDSGGSGLAGTIVPAAATLAAAGISYFGQSNLNKKNREWSEEQARIQYERNLALYERQLQDNLNIWQMQNEYDRPSASRQRMIESGYNPLYYGPNGEPNNAVLPASPVGAQMSAMPQIGNPVEAALDSAVKVAQVQNIRANTAKTNEESLSEVTKREEMLQNISNLKQEIAESLSREGLNKAQKDNLEKVTSWLDRLNDVTIREKEANIKYTDSQRKRLDELLEGEKIIQSKTIDEFEYKFKSMLAQARKDNALADLTEKDVEQYIWNHMQNGVWGTGLSVVNLLRGFVDKNTPTAGYEDPYGLADKYYPKDSQSLTMPDVE